MEKIHLAKHRAWGKPNDPRRNLTIYIQKLTPEIQSIFNIKFCMYLIYSRFLSPPSVIQFEQHIVWVKIAMDDVALMKVAQAADNAHSKVEYDVLQQRDENPAAFTLIKLEPLTCHTHSVESPPTNNMHIRHNQRYIHSQWAVKCSTTASCAQKPQWEILQGRAPVWQPKWTRCVKSAPA